MQYYLQLMQPFFFFGCHLPLVGGLFAGNYVEQQYYNIICYRGVLRVEF